MMEEDRGCEYLYVIAGGAVSFALVNKLSAHLVPPSANNTSQQSWKWRNVATSFVHSVITGLWALSSFYKDPHLREDLQRQYTASMHSLVSFSIGYFIYDALDMIANHRKRSTYELLLHHGLVILCYTVAVVSRQFVGFVAMSLVVEVNSVFLHARQMFIITSEPKHSLRYKVNSLLNIITFLIFRIFLLSWLTIWMVSNKNTISFGFLLVAFLGLGVIDIMNAILFGRILYVDLEILYSKESQNIKTEENFHQNCASIMSSHVRSEMEDSSLFNQNVSNNQNHVNGNGVKKKQQ